MAFLYLRKKLSSKKGYKTTCSMKLLQRKSSVKSKHGNWLMIDFNGMLTYLGLFHISTVGNCVYGTFIFTFLCCFLFMVQPNTIFKEIYSDSELMTMKGYTQHLRLPEMETRYLIQLGVIIRTTVFVRLPLYRGYSRYILSPNDSVMFVDECLFSGKNDFDFWFLRQKGNPCL